MLTRSENEIRAASGISLSFTGEEEGAKSGIALQSLAEQSHANLAEINANYSFGRQMGGRIVLSFIRDKIKDREEVVDIKKEAGQARKQVVLNGIDEHGQLTNNMVRARMDVVIGNIKGSDGYREHTMNRMMEWYASSPDSIKEQLYPMIIEASDMPKRDEYLIEYNRKQGRGASEEERAQMAEAQAKSAGEQAERAIRAEVAEIENKEAESGKTIAETAKLLWEIEGGDMQNDMGVPDVAAQQKQLDQEAKEQGEREQMVQKMRRASAERALADVG